jgi:integrase
MTNALRPSERFALRSKCFDQAESKMHVFETAYTGAIRPWGKTKKSLGRVHLPKELADDLWLWKQECPDSSPEAFIFPDADGGFHGHRQLPPALHKLAKDLELPKVTFQVIRRSIATLAQKKGTVKEIPESVQATVNAINAELRVKPEEIQAAG